MKTLVYEQVLIFNIFLNRQKNKSKDTGQMEIEHNRGENKQESKQDSNKEETMDVGGPQRKFVYRFI